MRLIIDQFHGARPRRDARLLGPFEAQIAENCRLYSGALGSWRKPVDVLAVGTNSLRFSNTFSNVATWPRTGLNSVGENANLGPDGSTSMDALIESAGTSQHAVYQSIAKGAAAETWIVSCSFKLAFRQFGFIEVSDGTTNLCFVIVDLISGTVVNSAASGNFTLVSTSVVAEPNSCFRVHITVTTNAQSVLGVRVGGTPSSAVYSYTGVDSQVGAYLYGAQARRASEPGPYRETLSVALPTIASIYLYKNQYWLVSAVRSSFTKGPLPGDTTDALYFTGGGTTYPSVTYDPLVYNGGTGRGDMPRQSYPIGLPAPENPPTVTPQSATGSVTSVSNLVATLGTQTSGSFTFGSVTTDGSRVIVQCNFQTLVETETVRNLTVAFRIRRGTRVIAEAERRVSLEFTGAVAEIEQVEALVSGEDTPPAGTHTYTFEVITSIGSGSITSTTHNHTAILVRYASTVVGLGSGHPFVPGDRIGFTGVGGFEALNASGLLVLSTTATTARIDVSSSETYTSGGTWTKEFESEDLQDTAWLLTFVTQIGDHVQEGPPSNASEIIAIGPGQPVQLSGLPTAPPADGYTYNILSKRIYRTNVRSDGNAAYRFVADIPIAQTTYTDSTLPQALGEELPSETWIRPPADMQGLIALPDGTMAGFSRNEICFCEPFQPHAWPVAYRLTVNFMPVGMASFGNQTIVLTRGRPALVVGSEPGSQRLEYVETSQPCLSATSIVDMGEYIVYAGDEGLVLVATGAIRTVTRDLFKKEEWLEYSPSTIVAAEYGGRYVGFYVKPNGARAGFVFDPQEPAATWTDLDFGADVAWTDPESGDLYLVVDETIVRFNDDEHERYAFQWRSRRYSLTGAENLAYAKVVADAYPVRMSLYAAVDPYNDESMTRVFSDEIADGEPFALPGDYLSTAFEIELVGRTTVKRVALGTSIEELNRPTQ